MRTRMVLLIGAAALALGSGLPSRGALADPCSNQHELDKPPGQGLASNPQAIGRCPKPPLTEGHAPNPSHEPGTSLGSAQPQR